jgi:hypothetical protein
VPDTKLANGSRCFEMLLICIPERVCSIRHEEFRFETGETATNNTIICNSCNNYLFAIA